MNRRNSARVLAFARKVPSIRYLVGWPASDQDGAPAGTTALAAWPARTRIDLSTSRMSAVSSMPASLMDRMQTVKGVRTIVDFSFFGGYFQDAKNALPAYVTNVDKLALVYPELNITAAQIAAMKATLEAAAGMSPRPSEETTRPSSSGGRP